MRIQLTRKIKDLVSKQSAQIESPIVPLANFVNAENEDELGLIDYLELGEESFSDTNETLFRMKDLIEWIGKKFIDKTSEINQFALMDQHQMNHGLKRRLINSIAVDMNSFTGRFTGETSLFSQYYQSAIDSYSKAVKISCELKSDSIEDVDNIIDSVTGFIDTIKTANEQNQTFLDAINNLPKMTKEVNQARRKMSQVIMNLITEFDIAINLSGALREEFVNYKEKL